MDVLDSTEKEFQLVDGVVGPLYKAEDTLFLSLEVAREVHGISSTASKLVRPTEESLRCILRESDDNCDHQSSEE